MKFEFVKKKQKTELSAEVVAVAAAAGALAAGCVIATYEALKSEKGQAAVATVKTATINAATKVKETTVAAADKVKATAVNAVETVKAKLPKKAEAECECECECACECEEAEETVEAPVEA